MKRHEADMICDLAEYYGIYDYKRVPTRLLGTLLVGLRDDSRIMQAYTGARASKETILLAAALDTLKLLLWSRTEDASKGKNKPSPVAPYYAGFEEPQKKRTDIHAFGSLDDFYKARAEAIERIETNARE